MGIKQIPTKKFKKFLKDQGVVYIRSKGDHDIYDRPDKPLLRPITIISKFKDIPILHIHTSLENLGIDKAKFEEIIKGM
jgi:predicted RNA binding protein YcfA (HicA-like mRNA interferase family)